jgi:scyllo-inositol 2-dehydrogenase (NADP+)
MATTGGNGDLRVALAGFGLAGSTFHAPLIATTEGLTLSAVVTRSGERRAQLADAHPEAVAVDALGDALDLADLVVVASPNRFHVPLAREAIAAGKHVIVDKPPAVRADEARRLRDEAAAAGVLLGVFHNRRWDDDVLTLAREIAAGRLGRVLRMESHFDRWRPEVREGAWREGSDPADGGGLLLDLGTHLVDQAVRLFGPVTTVYAELDVRRPGAVVEDDVFVALEHVGGVRSHLWAGVHSPDDPPRFRVLGERGAFVSHGLDQQEAQLRDGISPRDHGFGVRDVAAVGGAAFHDGSGEATTIQMERGRWDGYYSGVVAAIRDGAPLPVTIDEAIGVLDLLETARESSERGVVVAVA